MKDIIYQTFENIEEAIKSGETNIQIKAFQPDLTPLKNASHIKALSLRENGLYPKLLGPITYMSQLEFLDLSKNYLKGLPTLHLPRLKGIDLSDIDDLDIMKTLEQLSKLPALEYVCIKDCNIMRIGSILSQLPQLPNVRMIDVRGNARLDLVTLMQILPNLEDILIDPYMAIPYKKLFNILSRIPNFQHLELVNNQRSVIPPNIKKLKSLTSLVISLPKLKDTSFLSEMTSLRSLSFNAERLNIDALFDSIKDLALEKLHLQNIPYLPESITGMQSLRELSLELYTSNKNHFENMFGLLTQLPKLEVLHLKHFFCYNYPSDFGKLSQLKHIRLDFDKDFICLPKEVASFTNTHFEGRQPFMSRLNDYVQQYAKDDKLSDAQKLMYFGFLLEQQKALEETLEDPFVDLDPQNAVIFLVGHTTGYTQKEIKEKLKEYGFKVATKLHRKVTHVLVGRRTKVETLKEVVESSQYKIVIESHLKSLFVSKDNPFLMDADDESFDNMNRHILELLTHDDTNVQLGLTMMEEGGATVQAISVLYCILLSEYHYKVQTITMARKVFKRYAPPSFQIALKNKIPFEDAIFQQSEIDPVPAIIAYLNKYKHWGNFTITTEMLDQIGWDGIKCIISQCDYVYKIQMSSLNIDHIPDIFPPNSSIQRLFFNNNPIEELPQSLLKLKELQQISFKNCKIKDIKLLLQLPNLRKIYVRGNPLEEVPPRIRYMVKS